MKQFTGATLIEIGVYSVINYAFVIILWFNFVFGLNYIFLCVGVQ